MIYAELLILLACLCVLGFCLKLYTEYFKDVSQRNRKEQPK